MLAGCSASRMNEHSVDPDGTVHDRAIANLDFYGLGDRKLQDVDVSQTKTAARVKIGVAGQSTSVKDLIDLATILRGPTTLP